MTREFRIKDIFSRCGEETRIIPRIMQVIEVTDQHLGLLYSTQLRDSIYASENEKARLSQGGVTNDVIDSAVTSFVLQSIVQHGPPADRLCNKAESATPSLIISFIFRILKYNTF